MTNHTHVIMLFNHHTRGDNVLIYKPDFVFGQRVGNAFFDMLNHATGNGKYVLITGSDALFFSRKRIATRDAVHHDQNMGKDIDVIRLAERPTQVALHFL